MKKYFDNEEVEQNEKNPFGFCLSCGEPNRKPVFFRRIIICNDCYLERTDSIVELNKEMEKIK